MQYNSPASPVRRGEAMSSGHRGTGAGWYTRLQAALNNKTAIRFAKYLIPITILLLFFLLLSLTSCKSPATLTNDTQHHTRDSNYHATVHRIETHDTIIFGAPYIQSMVRPGDRTSLKVGGDACVPKRYSGSMTTSRMLPEAVSRWSICCTLSAVIACTAGA